MEIKIDFSIFDSPTSAYGSVSGSVELPNRPVVGETIALLASLEELRAVCVPLKLKVTSIEAYDPASTSDEPVYMLEDVFVPSRVSAEELSRSLSRNGGLFVDVYGD